MSFTTTDKIFHQLHLCMNLHRRKGHPQREGHQHHHGQGMVLRMLIEADGISQRDLADKLKIQPPSLSEVLDKLVTQELVERSAHPQDKRVSMVHITNKGRELLMEKQKLRSKMGENLLKDFSEEEKDSLLRLLEKLTLSLEGQMTRGHDVHHDHHGHAHHGHRRGHDCCDTDREHSHHKGKHGCCGNAD